jgi:hypothetical protein
LVRHLDVLRRADLARVGDRSLLAGFVASVLKAAGDAVEELLVAADASYVELIAVRDFVAGRVFDDAGALFIVQSVPRSAMGRQRAIVRYI